MSLNEDQQRVVDSAPGNYAVIGVPGSGKTTTLLSMIAKKVATGVDPSRIIGMTFTRAAADEMKVRLSKLGISGVTLCTIHSLSRKIVAEEQPTMLSGTLDANGSQYTYELKKLLGEKRKSRQIREGYDLSKIEAFIASCKAKGCGPVHGDPFETNSRFADAFDRECLNWASAVGISSMDLAQLYIDLELARYNRRLYDFDDMLLWAKYILMNAYVAQRWTKKYDVVIVDEAQDTSLVQWDIVKIVTGFPESSVSLYIFGDAAQSIYKFRYAEPVQFVAYCTHPSVHLLTLPKNYRSTATICDVANNLISGRDWALSGRMDAMTEEDKPIEALAASGSNLELGYIVNGILNDINSGVPLIEIAVLSRTSFPLNFLEIACIERGIPYRKTYGKSFFEEREVRTLMSYLKVICGMDYDGKACEMILNAPYRYISKNYIESCKTISRAENVALLDVIFRNSRELSWNVRKTVIELEEFLGELCEMAATALQIVPGANVDSLGETSALLLATILDRTEYLTWLSQDAGLGEGGYKQRSIQELQRLSESYPNPGEFIQYVMKLEQAITSAKQRRLCYEGDEAANAVTLSTIHRAKGCEWRNVYLMNVVEGTLPHRLNPDVSEELRLLYVAVTRAKRQLVVSGTGEVIISAEETSAAPQIVIPSYIALLKEASPDRVTMRKF